MSDDQKEQRRAIVSRPVDIEPFQPFSAGLRLDVGAGSVCGKDRSHNTDHYLAIRLGRSQETLTASLGVADLPAPFQEFSYALLVADGLGQDSTGALASRVALSTLAHLAIRYGKWNVRVDPESNNIAEQAEFFYRQTNTAVFEKSRADLRLAGMATSLTALYVAQNDLFFAHVGHSSAFLLRNGALIQLTKDQTLEPRRPVSTEGSRWGRATRSLEHLIAQTLGGQRTPPVVDIERIKLSSGDRLLLCTNGLTDAVAVDEIADALAARRRPDLDCQQLIELALASGGLDDVTVVLGDYTLQADVTRAGHGASSPPS